MATDTNQTIQDSRRAAMSFLQGAKNKERERKNRRATFGQGGGSRGNVNPAADFIAAGNRNEARAEAAKTGGETDFDLADRIRNMSDEDFERAVASGELTPDQIRRAGEYDWDVYMGDVWMEGDGPEKYGEPTYDEFMADPAKYGYDRGINEETDRAFDRYAKYGKKQ